MTIRPVARSVATRCTDFEAFRAAHPDFVNRIEGLRDYRKHTFERLAAMSRADQRGLVRKVLRLPKLRLLYSYEGLKAYRALRRETPASIEQMAARLCPFTPINEPREIRTAQNRGRSRMIVSFGPERRARQKLVADLLRYLHPPLPNQYLFRGGMPKAFNAIEEAVRNEGYRFGAEVDFTDFYGSVKLDGLADLLRPLPRAVVDNTVWDMTCRHDHVMDDAQSLSWATPTLDCQQGLALGSACSPIVGERIIACLLASDTPGRVVAYADNLFIMGRTAEEVIACLRQIRERTHQFAGWQLGLRGPNEPDDVPALHADLAHFSPTHFYFLRRVGRWEEDHFDWSPDERKLGEYGLGDDHEQSLSLEEIAELEERVSHWRRAYPDWSEGDLHEARYLGELAARRFYQAPTPRNLSVASHALIISYFAAGRYCPLSGLLPDGAGADQRRRRRLLEQSALQRLVTIANRAGWDASTAGLRPGL